MKKLIFKYSVLCVSALVLLAAVSVNPLSTEAQTPSTTKLTVTKVGTGTVTTADGFINCGATCNHNYNSTQSTTLTATPGAGYDFTSWSGACSGSGTGSCVLSMSVARNIKATFTLSPTPTPTPTPVSKALNVSKVGNGTVSSGDGFIACGATCSHSYSGLEVVALTATPSAGYVFGSWSGGGCSGTGLCTVTMSANRNIIATFNTSTPTPTATPAATPQPLVISKAGIGTGTVTSNDSFINCGVTCSHTYNGSQNVTLTATPAAGNRFSGWSGSSCSGSSTCLVTMNLPRSATATFVPMVNSLVHGWSWSSNIGWISFNSVENGAGGGPYQVKIVNDNMVGYAWSPNIGWIQFGGLSNFPPSGAPDGDAHISGGNIVGWARACAGTASGDCSTMNSRTDGWDGWIELSGVNHTITYNTPNSNTATLYDAATGNITGYAWGGDVVGWIYLDLTSTPASSNADLISTIAISPAPADKKYVTGTPYVLSGTVKNSGQTNVNSSFDNIYQVSTDGGGSWNLFNPAGTMNSLASTVSQNVNNYSGTAGTVGLTYMFRVCANRGASPVTETDSTDGSNCSTPVSVIVVASGGGGGSPSGTPGPSSTPVPLVVSLTVHDNRYGSVTGTSDSATIPLQRVRAGVPFDIIGTIDTSRFDTTEFYSTDTARVTTLNETDAIDLTGQQVTQNTPLVTYTLRGLKNGVYKTASVQVQAIAPSINEI